MKLWTKLTLINLLCIASFPALADDLNSQYSQQASSNTENIVKYLTNWGAYIGYDITQAPPAAPTQELINLSLTQLTEGYLFNTFLGAMPVDFLSAALAQFVPNDAPGASTINAFANAAFTYQNYSTPSTGQSGNVSASSLLDQPAGQGSYLPDPVSQALLNMMGTPNDTYCMNNDASAWISNCGYLYQSQVLNNILGTVPNRNQFFSYNYLQPVISQLNSNSLTGPLLYSTQNAAAGTSSPTPSSQNPGLTAQNQAQQAANFVRYATGAVTPNSLPKQADYDKLYAQAYPPEGSTQKPTFNDQVQAQNTLSGYLNGLRVYAAQSSVPISNLYYILSKRLPQNQGGDKSILTSQAMSEFNMATWRLFNPSAGSSGGNTPSKQWVEQLNGASSVTIQKEIAVLLAEMNYQMYLDRQIQERILLTNSIMLMQNLKSAQPSIDLNSQQPTEQ